MQEFYLAVNDIWHFNQVYAMIGEENIESGAGMDELKAIVASNLIRFRIAAGMTQAELGERLNYSDKTISKWERAEAIPDAYVLKQLGELFGVSVDYLLTEHAPGEKVPTKSEPSYSPTAITLVSIAAIWTLALLAFVILWIIGDVEWIIFICAVPVSLITWLVFHTIWDHGKNNQYIVMALVFSIIAVVYLILNRYNPWQLFLVVAPAEFVVFFSFHIKKRDKKR
jgi:transcriptional regulator with XRE-family HTH domain